MHIVYVIGTYIYRLYCEQKKLLLVIILPNQRNITVNMNILSSIIIGLFIVYGNAQSTTGNTGSTKCINPAINNSPIPKCCNALNYKNWIVSIREKQYDWHLSIGIILHPRAVLTLADKISNINREDIVISYGKKSQDRNVSQIILQPRHFTYLYSNFAILTLSIPIKFGTDVSSICWTNLSYGDRTALRFQYFNYLFDKESYEDPRGIIAVKSQNRDAIINNRTVNLVFGKNRVKNQQMYYFMGFETEIKYTSLKYTSTLSQTFNQFFWPNFQWIDQILQENLSKTVMEKKNGNGIKQLKFKLRLSKNDMSKKVNITIADVKSDISDQFKISATQV